MNQPKKYTSTELQRATGKVLNEAFNSGFVEIKHRDRGSLYLMTGPQLCKLISEAVLEASNAKYNN